MVENNNYKNWVTAWNHLTTWISRLSVSSLVNHVGLSVPRNVIYAGGRRNYWHRRWWQPKLFLQSEIIVCSVPSQVSRWLDPKEFHEELCKQERFVSLCLKDSGHFPMGRLFDCRCLQKVWFISSRLSSFYKWYKFCPPTTYSQT